jgi:hypothetical protein
VKLHEFRLTIFPGSGCVIEIASPDRRAEWNAAETVETGPGRYFEPARRRCVTPDPAKVAPPSY